MTTATADKPIEWYIEHPEDVDPTNTELVNRLMTAAGDETSKPATEAKTEGEAKPEGEKPKEEAKPAVEAKPAEPKPKEEEPKGVLAADGKSIIPYSVLAEERRRNQQLDSALKDVSQTVADLTGQIERLEKGGDKGQPVTDAAITKVKETIEKAREEAPWLADTLEAILGSFESTVGKLNERIETLVAERATERQDIERDVKRDVNATIDNVPLLAHFKANNENAWAMAIAFDNTLKESPAWEGKSMKARFEKVAEMVVGAMGESVVPAELRTQPKAEQPKPGEKPGGKGLSDAEVQAAAQAKLKETGGVTTLTDLPGGAAPAQTEEQSLETISVQDLARKFDRMSPEQQAAYIAGFNR